MLRACKYCGRAHDSKVDCGQRPKRVKESTEITKLRTCRRWGETRHRVYERDHHLCRLCLLQGTFTAESIEAHHIIPLTEAPELAYDDNNIICLCTKHHKAADAGGIDRKQLLRLAKSPI